MKPTHSIQESNVFNNSEHYEIELEIVNEKAYNLLESELIFKVKKGIQHVLCGLQSTNYPVSYTEMNNILMEYLALTKSEEEFKLLEEDNGYNRKKRKNRWNFCRSFYN